VDGVRGGWSAYRPDSPCCARFPMPSARSSRVIIPGFDADWTEGPSWPCRAMRLASLQRLLGPPHRGMARAVAVGTTSRMPIRPNPPTQSATHTTIPAVVACRRSTGTRRTVMESVEAGIALRRADSVPVRLIAEGSGGRSRRSSP